MSARWWWLAVLVLLGACKPIRPEAARYLCTRDLPIESQCLDGWRCGADGYCFDPAGIEVLPTRCEDPATDCPDGWKCSLTRECFDPALPTAASLPCRDPATDCPTGWKCGLDQRCLDPEEAGPWRCEETDRDCTGGWTCGAQGLCFDRADAGRVGCRSGVTTDCNDGWRCGIDGLCQQLDAGFPWPCEVDGHCEASWRCGPGGRCVDATDEALRPNHGAPLGSILDLGWPAAVPDEVALGIESAEEAGSVCADLGGPPLQAIALRFGRRLELAAFSVRGGLGLAAGCDGGVPVGAARAVQASVDLGAEPVRQVVQLGRRTHVAVDGGIRTFVLTGSGQVRELTFRAAQFDRLRANRARPCLLRISPTSIVCMTPNGGVSDWAGTLLPAVDGGTARITDAIEWTNRAGDVVVFAGTDQGLFARQLDGQGVPSGNWAHVLWSNAGASVLELRLSPQPVGPPLLLVVVREGTGSRTAVWTLQVTSRSGPVDAGVSQWLYFTPLFTRGFGGVEGRSYDLAWVEHYVYCDRPMRGWVEGVETSGTPRVVGRAHALFRCELEDGGVQLTRVVSDPAFGSSPKFIDPRDEVTPLTGGAQWTVNDDTTVAMAERGYVYLASEVGTSLRLDPWIADSTPDAVTGSLDRWVMRSTPQRLLRLGSPDVDATITRLHTIGAVDAGFGLMSTTSPGQLFSRDTYRLAGGVEGRPDLAVYEATFGQSTATFLVKADSFGPPGSERPVDPLVLGRAAPTAGRPRASVANGGGGALWFQAQGDQLLVAPLAGTPQTLSLLAAMTNQSLPSALPALVPLPGAPLTHVLALPADASSSASYGQALVVASGRLFHVRADNPIAWRATEPLDTASEILESWADGTRLRVGDREGRVRSYPSRVEIGPVLPQGATALDFVDVCGVTYALSSKGLYRLAATAGAVIGTWAEVPLPSGLSLAGGGVLYTDGTGLLVFDDAGRTANVTALSCAEPL